MDNQQKKGKKSAFTCLYQMHRCRSCTQKKTFLPEKVGEGEELGCEMTEIQVIVYCNESNSFHLNKSTLDISKLKFI